MHNSNIKEDAHRLLDDLPKSATWGDLMCKINTARPSKQDLKIVRQGEL